MHKWSDDRWSGGFLILCSLVGLIVMAHHPTTHMVLEAGNPPRMAGLNRLLHSVAIAAMPIQFIGLLGLGYRLGDSFCTRSALVTQGFGLIAGMGAAVASGFVATNLMLDLIQAGPSAQPSPMLGYTASWNQGFAAIYVVCTAVSVLLFSIAMLSSSLFPKALGWLGVAAGGLVTLWQLLTQHHLGVHEFGMVVLAEAVWMVWTGVVLVRMPKAAQ